MRIKRSGISCVEVLQHVVNILLHLDGEQLCVGRREAQLPPFLAPLRIHCTTVPLLLRLLYCPAGFATSIRY